MQTQCRRRRPVEVASLGGGVVVGDAQEIEFGLHRGLVKCFGASLGVRVVGVGVEVAAIPSGPLANRIGSSWLRGHGTRRIVEFDVQSHVRACVGYLAEVDGKIPRARRDGAVVISGRRIVGRDRDLSQRGVVGPASNSFRAREWLKRRVGYTPIQGTGFGGAKVDVDGDPCGPRRNLERDVDVALARLGWVSRRVRQVQFPVHCGGHAAITTTRWGRRRGVAGGSCGSGAGAPNCAPR